MSTETYLQPDASRIACDVFDWRMTKKDCEKVAKEFIEKLKKEGLA